MDATAASACSMPLEGWRDEQAGCGGSQIRGKLNDIAPMVKELGMLGWDGGGQPFVARAAAKIARRDVRADGHAEWG